MDKRSQILGSASPAVSRRAFHGQVMAGAVALSAPAYLKLAHAAEYTIKFANNSPLTYAMNVRAREAADRIRKESDGKVNIQIFPNNQLGGDPDMFGQVRSGAIQMYAVPGLLAQSAVADCGIHCLAFAFKDYAAVWRAIDGDLGAFIRRQMTSTGVYPMKMAWDNGFRQITSRDRVIHGPQDLVGFKIRTPAFPMIVSIFESLGAAPTAINIKETYAALQTKLADGQENPTLVLEVWKFYEVQKYCALSNHLWDGFWTGVNLKYWESLPTTVQQLVERHFNQASTQQRGDVESQDKRMQTDMEKKGVTFNAPDQAAFRDALRKAGYYDRWSKSFTPEAWSLLEKYAGKLG